MFDCHAATRWNTEHGVRNKDGELLQLKARWGRSTSYQLIMFEQSLDGILGQWLPDSALRHGKHWQNDSRIIVQIKGSVLHANPNGACKANCLVIFIIKYKHLFLVKIRWKSVKQLDGLVNLNLNTVTCKTVSRLYFEWRNKSNLARSLFYKSS